jgi:putative transferase (TIGR04331 family)
MPAPRLAGRPAIGASNARRGLLLATTHMTRYPLNFLTSVGEFEAYLDAHRRFVGALPAELRRLLRVRLHRDDFGWDLAARWRRFAPDVAMDSPAAPFQESLRECRIYVCDHHSTTFVEALSADKPTVLFWDPGTVDIAPEYADRYAALREAGILHDAPEAAARRLDAVHGDVERWWRGAAVQHARQRFCEALGRTAADAAAQWAAELRHQLRQTAPDWPARAR